MNPFDNTALANAARELLIQGDAVGAERVLAPVFQHLKSDHSVLHLMGLIKKAQNQLEAAERHFRGAIAHALSEGAYYNDLGVVLQSRGEYAEAARVLRAALALRPEAVATRVNLVRCLMEMGDYVEAEREAHAYIAIQPGAEAWTLLGHVQRGQENNEDSLASAEKALKFGPQMRGLKYNYATALDRVGRSKEALVLYEALARAELDTPDLALNFMRALFAEGRKKDAEVVAEKAVTQWPSALALHSALARMRWLRGEGENATALMEAEIDRRPRDLSLRLACADALHRGQHLAKASTVLEAALRLAPDTPALLTALGIVLDELDRPLDGLKALRRVVDLSPTARSAQRNLLSTLMRAGQPGEALKIARTLRAEDPDEQYLLACEAIALRMLGERTYRDMCDYDRMVRTYDIPAPPNFFTSENFNASFADLLRSQHRINAHPLDQHLHNGGQTGRNLINSQEQNVKSFIGAVDVAVRDYISRLQGDDPVSARRRDGYRYSGLWSVRLTKDGYQPNHVHDRGWISSAYYVALMPTEKPRDPRAGWLKLGEPNRAPAGCGPEKFIEPKLGMLVLFPSYFWHGTAPFEGSERLSAAFDVVPSSP